MVCYEKTVNGKHGFALSGLLQKYHKTIHKYGRVSDQIKACEALKHHKTRDKYLSLVQQESSSSGVQRKIRTRDPVVAFVTFTSDEARNAMLNSYKRVPAKQRPRLRQIRKAKEGERADELGTLGLETVPKYSDICARILPGRIHVCMHVCTT